MKVNLLTYVLNVIETLKAKQIKYTKNFKQEVIIFMKELNLFCFITNLSVAVLIGALLPILPILTRKSFLFGVKIPLEECNCPEAKNLKKRYITVCLTGTLIIFALIIAQFIAIPDMTLLATMYFPLLFAAVQMAAFIPNWKQAIRLKEAKGWKVSESSFAETKSSHSRGNLSDLPWVWYIVGLILIIISAAVALAKYPGIPNSMPTHFDSNMQPDGWASKNIWNVLILPVFNLGMLLFMWLIGVIFVRAKLQIDPQNPELSFTQHKIYRKRMGHSLGLLTLGIVILFVFIGFMLIFPGFSVPFWLMMVLSCGPAVLLTIVLVVSGQGGCKIKPKIIPYKSAVEHNNPVVKFSGRGDDKYWAIGMFYHNPEDPAIFVEDRFGNNVGFNYSRLPVKIGMAIIALVTIAAYVWITIILGQII